MPDKKQLQTMGIILLFIVLINIGLLIFRQEGRVGFAGQLFADEGVEINIKTSKSTYFDNQVVDVTQPFNVYTEEVETFYPASVYRTHIFTEDAQTSSIWNIKVKKGTVLEASASLLANTYTSYEDTSESWTRSVSDIKYSDPSTGMSFNEVILDQPSSEPCSDPSADDCDYVASTGTIDYWARVCAPAGRYYLAGTDNFLWRVGGSWGYLAHQQSPVGGCTPAVTTQKSGTSAELEYGGCSTCTESGWNCELKIDAVIPKRKKLSYYPDNIEVYLGNSTIYSRTYNLQPNERDYIYDFSSHLQQELDSCTPDQEGYCMIPVSMRSNKGRLRLDSLYIKTESEYSDDSNSFIKTDHEIDSTVNLTIEYFDGNNWIPDFTVLDDYSVLLIADETFNLSSLWNNPLSNEFNTNLRSYGYGKYRAKADFYDSEELVASAAYEFTITSFIESQIKTLKDTYYKDEIVNITDPPLDGTVSEINFSDSDAIFIGEQGETGKTMVSGDFNGDGYEDLIINIPSYTDYEDNTAGKFYFVEGKKVSYNQTRNLSSFNRYFSAGSQYEYEYSGSRVIYPMASCDMNNDGYDDLIIGAPYKDAGEVYVFYGSEDLLEDVHNLSDADAVFTGEQQDDYAGHGLACFDINDDNLDDLIIGSPGYDHDTTVDYGYGPISLTINNAGKVYFIYSSGTDFSGTIQLSNIQTNLVSERIASPNGESIGYSLEKIGDFNKDGYDDLLIGAPGMDDYGSLSNNGRTYLLSGTSSITNEQYINDTAEITFGCDTYSQCNTGDLISSAGDFNKDGYDDILMKGESFNSLLLFYGNNFSRYQEEGYCSGDYGCSSSTNRSDCESRTNEYFTCSWTSLVDISYNKNITDLGKEFIPYYGIKQAHSGDFNNDGYSDIFVLAGDNNDYDYRDNSYIILGCDSCWDFGTCTYEINPGYEYGYYPVKNASECNGTYSDYIYGDFLNITLLGEEYDEYAGYIDPNSISSDLNNDGASDIVISDPKQSVIGYQDGKVYIIYGSGGTQKLTPEEDQSYIISKDTRTVKINFEIEYYNNGTWITDTQLLNNYPIGLESNRKFPLDSIWNNVSLMQFNTLDKNNDYGTYRARLEVYDTDDNLISEAYYNFTIKKEQIITQIKTLQDVYFDNENIYLTDPPINISSCPSDIISYWTFDNQSDPAKDDYGNNDGTVNGAAWSSDGKLDGSIDFDGTGDYLEVDNNPDLDITGPFTISIWIYKPSSWNPFNQRYISIISKGNIFSTGQGYGIHVYERDLDSSIRPEFWIKDSSGTSIAYKRYTDTGWGVGEWKNLAGVYNLSHVLLYEDGYLIAASNATNSPGSTSSNLFIGEDDISGGGYANGYPWIGSLDETVIFDRALSSEEILQLYNKVNKGKNYCEELLEECGNGILEQGEECDDNNTMDGDGCSSICEIEQQEDTNLCDNLVSYWNFNNQSDIGYDFIENNPCTVNGAGFNENGILEGSSEFIDTGENLNCGNYNNLNLDRYTIMAWINSSTSSQPDFAGILNKYNNGADCNYGLDIVNGNQIRLTQKQDSPDAWKTITYTIEDNRWYFVAGTYNGTHMSLYIDGTLISSVASSDPRHTSAPLMIGVQSSSATSRSFHGKIDEAAIFNIPLSEKEIQELYNNSIDGKDYCNNVIETAACIDLDNDGYGTGDTSSCPNPEQDCNDNNPNINPGAEEVPYNLIDDDCDGDIDEFTGMKTTAEENQSIISSVRNTTVFIDMYIEYFDDSWEKEFDIINNHELNLTAGHTIGLDTIWNNPSISNIFNTNNRSNDYGKYRAKVDVYDIYDELLSESSYNFTILQKQYNLSIELLTENTTYYLSDNEILLSNVSKITNNDDESVEFSITLRAEFKNGDIWDDQNRPDIYWGISELAPSETLYLADLWNSNALNTELLDDFGTYRAYLELKNIDDVTHHTYEGPAIKAYEFNFYECQTDDDCSGSDICILNECAPPLCENGVKDPDETDIDCGGSCPRCTLGKSCINDSDCITDFCESGTCTFIPNCTDNTLNQDETDIDCGGSICNSCLIGESCISGSDCITNLCESNICISNASCSDGIKNQDETDIDCGGSCDPCNNGQSCNIDTDCTSDYCNPDDICSTPTCSDGFKNQDESDIDCGGAACSRCENGKTCNSDSDCTSNNCESGTCTAQSSQQNGGSSQDNDCDNDIKDNDESDIDCGGQDCSGCSINQTCEENSDCKSNFCNNGICDIAQNCNDGIKNQDESDIDCGGVCVSCEINKNCRTNSDCLSNYCEAGICKVAPTCNDNIQNQFESDTDCGGPCKKCINGRYCNTDSDCISNYCDVTCKDQPKLETCNDGIKNQGESDIDCGGPCSRCENGKTCNSDSDCLNECDPETNTCYLAPTLEQPEETGIWPWLLGSFIFLLISALTGGYFYINYQKEQGLIADFRSKMEEAYNYLNYQDENDAIGSYKELGSIYSSMSEDSKAEVYDDFVKLYKNLSKKNSTKTSSDKQS